MKVTLISGSHRANSQSLKVATYMQKTILESKLFDEAEIISLSDNPLPLWEEKIWAGDEDWQQRLAPLQASLQASDAFVIISPEWHGQAPAGLKNFFLMCSTNEMAHKPALLTALSSVDGGAYTIAELRMSSYKNNRLCYIPEQLIVRNVESVLNENPADNNAETHAYFADRVQWTLTILQQYAIAMKPLHANIDHSVYTSGM